MVYGVVFVLIIISLFFSMSHSRITGEAVASTISEKVTCSFSSSTSSQKCYSNKGDTCAGTTSCSVYVRGARGEVLTWKSSCSGDAKTTIDGKRETIKFDCAVKCQSPQCPDGSYPKCYVENGQCICEPCPAQPECKSTQCPDGSWPTCKVSAGVCTCSTCPEIPTEKVTYQGVLDILTNSKNINPYERQGSAVTSFLADGKTPNQFCKENGYGNCIMVFNDFDEVYFDSNDLTCSGKINYINRHNILNSPADCNTLFNEDFYKYADPRPKQATCLNGGRSGSDFWESYYVNFICVKP